jgi:hypothetical protein
LENYPIYPYAEAFINEIEKKSIPKPLGKQFMELLYITTEIIEETKLLVKP